MRLLLNLALTIIFLLPLQSFAEMTDDDYTELLNQQLPLTKLNFAIIYCKVALDNAPETSEEPCTKLETVYSSEEIATALTNIIQLKDKYPRYELTPKEEAFLKDNLKKQDTALSLLRRYKQEK